MEIIKRAKAPTPSFFKKLRTLGLILAAIGGTVVTAPIALPTVMLTVAGYLVVAGGVMGAVSQITVQEPPSKPKGRAVRKTIKL